MDNKVEKLNLKGTDKISFLVCGWEIDGSDRQGGKFHVGSQGTRWVASLSELGGCDVAVAVATLAVPPVPATTKARQYCRGGAAVRSCSTR